MTDAAFDPAAIAADAVALAELDGATGRERVPIDWLLRRLREAPASRSVDGASNLVWMFWLIAERESTRLPHGPARPSSGARPISPNSTDRTPRWLASRSRQACGCRWSAWTAGQPARCASPIPWSLRSAAPDVRSACRKPPRMARPTRTRRPPPAYQQSPSAAVRARTCRPRPSGSAPAPSSLAPGNCAPSSRKSWSSLLAPRGTDHGTTGS
jgi:hypothetical protein